MRCNRILVNVKLTTPSIIPIYPRILCMQNCENLNFLLPLIDAMTAKKPSERPTAAEALKQFKSLAYSQNYFALRQRLIPRGENKSTLAIALENFGILVDSALYPARYAVRLPKRAFASLRNSIASRRTNRVKLRRESTSSLSKRCDIHLCSAI